MEFINLSDFLFLHMLFEGFMILESHAGIDKSYFLFFL